MKQRLIGSWLVAGVLLAELAGLGALAQQGSTDHSLAPAATGGAGANAGLASPVAGPPEPARPIAAKPPNAVQEILDMTRAGVAPEVIHEYVEHAVVAAFPSAAEIIALKNAGVPNEISVALMKRAGDLKAPPLQPVPGPVAGVVPMNRNVVNAGRFGLPDPESYDYWWYHYAYPRTLASANARLYGPYASFGSYPSLSTGFYPYMAFHPHPWGGPFRGR